MNIMIFGAGGFLGTNLTKAYNDYSITVYDEKEEYFDNIKSICSNNINYVVGRFSDETSFNELLNGKDVVFHLVSSTIPATSNNNVEMDMEKNVIATIRMLDACVKQNVKKIVFISSGGAAYGKDVKVPIKENNETNPISSYGIQKITIEKILYLYEYLFDLDYRIIRLANPFGPYQRPNGELGVVTTFVDDAIKDKPLTVYGDGKIVRDFIYVDDVMDAIKNIVNGKGVDDEGKTHKVFNVGSGTGRSINDVIKEIEKVFNKEVSVNYNEGRKSDVPVNYLDISLYESIYGKLVNTSFEEGIKKTKEFLENHQE